MRVVEKPVQAQDLMATISHAMGLDKDHVNYTPNGRPITTVDASGKVIRDLFRA